MIVDNLPEGVLVVDSFNDILFANSTALSYLETPEKDIIGKNIGFGPVPGAIKTILLPKSIDPARQCFEACFRNLYWNGEASYLITLRPHENGKPTSILAGKSEIMDALPTIERSEECQLRFSPQGLILDALDISPGIFIKDPGSENNLSIFDVLSDEHSQLLKGKIELLSAYQPMQIFNAPYAYGLQSNQHLQFILQGFFDKSGEIYEYLLLGSLVNSFFPYSKESSVMTSIVDHASQPIAFTDMNGNFTHANQQFFNLLGYRSQDIYGKQINSILSSVHTPEYFNKIVTSIFQRGGWQGECWLQHKNQHIFPAEVQATTIFHKNGEVACCAIYICDKSELRLVENNLRHLALHDPLTNLPNRTLLLERLYQSIRMANKKEEQFAVLHLDLDGFKAVNNTYGHIAGDQLLKLISERLLTCIHKDDLLARMGGDEFAIISYPTEYMGLLPASVTAQKIINDLTRPCLIEENELFITASIGISLYPEDGTNATSLLKNADIAMYRAKELGKNNFQFYSEELNRRVLKRLDMGNHLRHALERDEFRLVYQPIVESHSRRIVAAEALLRWEHTQLGRIMPDDFISLAEETGLIVDIGKWVIQTACKQHMVLLQSGYSPVQMSVNISGRQLEQDDFVSFIEHTLANTEMKPDRLVLEITESFLMEDIEKNRKKLVEIRKLGVKISIDDFGTGYSSLNSLVNLPIDSLKIDKTFVDAMEENPHGLSLVKGVISIGHNLDMEIIAEGVEHNAQAILLETHGCDQLQGYYFGMPMNFNELCRLIDPLL
jgi:diguanylate cyclase (GGDEF)-like protein/PAS domain S-box-containing protein